MVTITPDEIKQELIVLMGHNDDATLSGVESPEYIEKFDETFARRMERMPPSDDIGVGTFGSIQPALTESQLLREMEKETELGRLRKRAAIRGTLYEMRQMDSTYNGG